MSISRALALATGLVALGMHAAQAADTERKTELVICADPNNLPFSNRAGEGFEDRIASLLAKDLHTRIRYVWWAQRRGFVRNTLNQDKCDIWPGIARGVNMVATTRPYYRSTYVFVTRAASPLDGLTLDDPRLRSVRIGVQMIGNNATNTPPAHALARRHITDNVRGYMLYGDYSRPNPPAAIVEAVAHGDIDVALVWGPLAGYFAASSPVPLRLTPVTPTVDDGVWPMTYDIAVGVNRHEPALRQKIDALLVEERPAIEAILRTYHVPPAGAPRTSGDLAPAAGR